MKENKNFTDEELLSFLIGDAPIELTKEIEKEGNCPQIQERLAWLREIRKEVLLTQTYMVKPRIKWNLAITVVAMVAFVTGIYIGSHFEIKIFTISFSHSTKPSLMLNWNKTDFANRM